MKLSQGDLSPNTSGLIQSTKPLFKLPTPIRQPWFRVSNSTNPVNITNPVQMAGIGWSDFPIFDLSIPGYVYIVDLSLPQFVSPTTLILECLNCEYMEIVVSGTGQYVVEQHINTLQGYVRED